MKLYVFKALFVLLLSMIPQLSYADVPGTITFQGKLSDTSGKSLEGTTDITFSIPTLNWTEQHFDVPLKGGVFSVLLGKQTSLKELDFSQPHLLRIEVNGISQEVEMSSVPYALHAKTVDKVKANNVGSVFIRWGNANAPEGTTLLYSGFGFNEHYTQGGGSAEPICVKSGDPGAPSSGSLGDLLYPLGTGDASRMPLVYVTEPK